jgi:outer membrane putative beta-barrel porin/alpha-amylase
VNNVITRALVVASVFGLSTSAFAQSRPLVTEDPETVPQGHMLIEAGVDFAQDMFFPASGLLGNFWRIGTFGMSFGVGPIAELQIDGGLRNRLLIKSRSAAPLSSMLTVVGDKTSDFEDATIGAKIRFASETARRPAMAVRFWTRLPNAGNESGLGLDTTDFHFGIAVGKTVQSVRVVGNFGFGILPDPVRGDRQNDVIDYGVSVARAIRVGVEVVGELNGRFSSRSGVPPIGTESHSTMRVGSRYTQGPVRIDGALVVGVMERDPTWGFSAGLTWVFKAFSVNVK